MRTIRTRALLTSVLLLLSLHPSPATGQQESWGYALGYVGNAPRLVVGGSAHVLLPGSRFGLYADAKFDLTSSPVNAHVREGVTRADVEAEGLDQWFRDERVWRSFNAGLVFAAGEDSRFYAGVGYARHQRYSEFHDRTLQRGDAGVYWVEDPEGSGSTMNVLVGTYFRVADPLLVQFGVETVPRGFTLGLSFSPGRT
ncbi:MAG: hypothetical protein ACOCVZ_02440 [Gemmatimonadota bacterium]